MSKKVDIIHNQLSTLGLTPEESKIYLAIMEGRGDTALTLARALGLPRTKVYRLLDSLIKHQLVATQLGHRGSRFAANPPDSLDFLLADREHELTKLRSVLSSLKSGLAELAAPSAAPSQVLYLSGLDGLKQITYNSLRARGELLTYEIGTLDSFLSHAEAESLRSLFVARRIKIRTLTNATSLKAWTSVPGAADPANWELRHLPPQATPFQFEILIYNDVYCLYRYDPHDPFAVEIHCSALADMQRQLFNYLWQSARPFKVLDSHGTAKLV